MGTFSQDYIKYNHILSLQQELEIVRNELQASKAENKRLQTDLENYEAAMPIWKALQAALAEEGLEKVKSWLLGFCISQPTPAKPGGKYKEEAR